MVNLVDETGIKRRPLIKAAILLPAGGLAIAAAAPLIGSLIKNPNDDQPCCSRRAGARTATTGRKYA